MRRIALAFLLLLCSTVVVSAQWQVPSGKCPTGRATGTGFTANDCFIEVDTIAALKAIDRTATGQAYNAIYVKGYYTTNDGGQGFVQWDAASAAADNGGTVFQPNSLPATGRWLRYRPNANVVYLKQFGARCNGTNDATFITAAIIAIPAQGGDLVLPPGACTTDTIIDGDSKRNITIRTETGGRSTASPPTQLIYSGAAARFLDFRSCQNCSLRNVQVVWTNAGFTGNVVDFDRGTAASDAAFGGVFDSSFFPSGGGAATCISVNRSIEITVADTTFGGCNVPIQGQGTGGGDFANRISILRNQFVGHIGFPLVGLGGAWTISDNTVQAGSDGRCRFISTDAAHNLENVLISGNLVGDISVGGGTCISIASTAADNVTLLNNLLAGDVGLTTTGISLSATMRNTLLVGNTLQLMGTGIALAASFDGGRFLSNNLSFNVTTPLTATTPGANNNFDNNTPSLSLCTSTQMYVGQSAADPTCKTLGGAITIAATGTTSFVSSNLTALAGVATQGIYVRTGAASATTRALVAPAAGFTITNSDGVAGNLTFVLANDLAAVEGLGTTGFARRTGADAWDTVVDATGIAAWIATPSSANLRATLTDESGTGAALFAGGNIGAATGTSLMLTGGILEATFSQNAPSEIVVVNSNGGTSAQSSFQAHNGTTLYRFGMRGTAQTAYGMLAAGEGFSYSGANINIMSDGGVIKFASGGNTERLRINAPGHLVPTGTIPVAAACGTTPAIRAGSTDVAGEVTMGTATPTGCIITFGTAYAAAPFCVVTWQANLASMQYTISTSAITLVQTATSSNKVNWMCMGG